MKHIYLIIYLILFLLNISNIYSQSNPSLSFLNQTLTQNDKSMNRLSSGTLLWTDSPSSRAIYERLESHVNFLSMNMRNNEDMIVGPGQFLYLCQHHRDRMAGGRSITTI